jgi:hypothetical protein
MITVQVRGSERGREEWIWVRVQLCTDPPASPSQLIAICLGSLAHVHRLWQHFYTIAALHMLFIALQFHFSITLSTYNVQWIVI